jgi:hypothetical protein
VLPARWSEFPKKLFITQLNGAFLSLSAVYFLKLDDGTAIVSDSLCYALVIYTNRLLLRKLKVSAMVTLRFVSDRKAPLSCVINRFARNSAHRAGNTRKEERRRKKEGRKEKVSEISGIMQ